MGAISNLLPLAKDLWKSWGIESLVLASFLFQVILGILGRRRKYMNYFFLELIIWGSYLLATHIATLALGKLTQKSARDDEAPIYSTMLEGLLAPLLLMHLSHPDSMIAYSIEDSRLGIRQMLNLAVTVSFVIWILISCWDLSSRLAWLYIPLFIGGMIKSASTVLALKSVYDDSISAKEISTDKTRPAIEKYMPQIIKSPQKNPTPLGIILMAYYRFNCLRPHLVNWLYHPGFVAHTWMSIDSLSPEDVFIVTEVELSFMFDVLYSKEPILYTKFGLISRFLSFWCLVSTLVGFSILFRSAFLLDMYVTYTYALLIGSTLIELYQIVLLPFSDWAIVQMCNHPKKLLVVKVLPSVVSICFKQKRWSKVMQQFELKRYCMNGHPPRLLKLISKLLRQEEELRRYWVSTQKTIPLDLKEVVVYYIIKLEDRRKESPFTKRGQWTLDTFNNITRENFEDGFEIAFDKSIIIWHIATSIIIQKDLSNQDSKYYHASKLLSNYMMYLLARHPYMLSVTTADITLGYASSMLKTTARGQDPLEQITGLHFDTHQKPKGIKYEDTLITRKWDLLKDVQKLTQGLQNIQTDKWEFISSVWVEMLCYAAYNCQVYHHAERLRRGGELITHVWLLLAHNTNKFQTSEESHDKQESQTDTSSPKKPQKRPTCLGL